MGVRLNALAADSALLTRIASRSAIMLPDPGIDRRQRARLEIGCDSDRFQRACRHHAATGRRLRPRTALEFGGIGVIAEAGHVACDEGVAERRSLLRSE